MFKKNLSKKAGATARTQVNNDLVSNVTQS